MKRMGTIITLRLTVRWKSRREVCRLTLEERVRIRKVCLKDGNYSFTIGYQYLPEIVLPVDD